MIQTPWSKNTSELLEELSVDLAMGLSPQERERRLEKYGPNSLPVEKSQSILYEFLQQLKNPIVMLLIGVSILSGATGKIIETVLIVSIVGFMAGVGVFLERQSAKSLEKLKALQSTTTTILSSGKSVDVPTESIVPGDIILLAEGDKVAADARVINSQDVSMDEASLTGESLPVRKTIESIEANTTLADQKNMVFSGTAVVAGNARVVVVATGVESQLGKITSLLRDQKTRLTPIQKELEMVGKVLLFLTIGATVIILTIYTLRGTPLIESLLVTMSLAIAFIPEGLSAVLTVTLALAVKEMVVKKVVVKKLLAAEGLGTITHIATDKTGTITEGHMRVEKVYLDGHLYKADDKGLVEHDHFERLINIVRYCNNNKGPTEQAMVAFLDFHGYSYELEKRTAEYRFTSGHKRMSVIRKEKGEHRLFSKGAPDILIPLCTRAVDGKTQPFPPHDKKKALQMAEDLAGQGFRVLALADKNITGFQKEHSRETHENELTFIGLVAFMDPVRNTVKETVTSLLEAGVTPLMITGDHPAIAKYIAIDAGIISRQTSQDVLTGNDLDQLFDGSAKEAKKRILEARVFARVRPEHKVKIIETYQNSGFRIAMTGDGVNDAAAIKQADVGIAMSNGMDVTRDIADVVITGTYDALIRAVAIGRTVKLRTQLYLHYLLSGNACQVGLFIVAVAGAFPTPLTPIMLLIINVLTDAMPAMAMAVEPEDPDITKRKVQKNEEGIVSMALMRGVLVQGVISTAVLSLAFIYYLPQGIELARTVVFTLFIFQKALRGITARSFTKSVFQYGLFTNKLMNLAIPVVLVVWFGIVYVAPKMFEVVPLPTSLALTLFGISFVFPVAEEITKRLNATVLKR